MTLACAVCVLPGTELAFEGGGAMRDGQALPLEVAWAQGGEVPTGQRRAIKRSS
jgi:hypothetical protein